MTITLAEVTVDDLVVYWPDSVHDSPEILPVERATKTQLVARGERWLRSTGKAVGSASSSPWVRCREHICVLTEEIRAEVEETIRQHEEKARRYALRRVIDAKVAHLDSQLLERLVEVLTEWEEQAASQRPLRPLPEPRWEEGK